MGRLGEEAGGEEGEGDSIDPQVDATLMFWIRQYLSRERDAEKTTHIVRRYMINETRFGDGDPTLPTERHRPPEDRRNLSFSSEDADLAGL